MSLKFVRGDLFESGCAGLVNPVNCVGVMGKGLAKEFRNRFPHMFKLYQQCCSNGLLRPGGVYTYSHTTECTVFNVATKDHWQDGSRIEWIREGLVNLGDEINLISVASVALPALGCGLGGLNWLDVKDCIEEWYSIGSVQADLLVYEP